MPYTLAFAPNDQSGLSSPGQYGNHIVKAQLPNQQRTTVSIPAGMSIREALCKALKLRKLEPDMCSVFRLSPHSQTKQRIDWDVDVAMLKGDEIIVETKDRVPMHTQISHNFVQSFLTLSKCHFCQEFLITGIRCLTCGIEFHRNCSSSVPKLCEPAIDYSDYYKHLLGRSSGFSPKDNFPASDSPTNIARFIRPRARSADENSKHKSKSVSNQADLSSKAVNNPPSVNSPVDRPSEFRLPPSTQSNNRNIPTSINNLQTHIYPLLNSVHNITITSTRNQRLSTPKEYPRRQTSSNHQNRELWQEKWEIEYDEVIRGPRIGQGSFATIYRGIWYGDVALKELNVKDPTPAQLQNFKNEVVVLKKLRHANVLLFLGYILKPRLIIVTQWCSGRSLYKHLHVEDRREFSNRDIRNVAFGVAQGMEYLHAKNILHRDLKSNNILVQHDLTKDPTEDLPVDSVKIGDFGLAIFKTHFEGDQQIYHPTGSILWMAPEVIRTKPGVNPFTFQSDVYSYGIVLYELLSRKLPYFDFKHKDALLFLIGLGDPKRSPKLNLDVIRPDRPEDLKALMLNCIERDHLKRPLFNSFIKNLRTSINSRISRSTSEPLRLDDLNGSFTLNGLLNY